MRRTIFTAGIALAAIALLAAQPAHARIKLIGSEIKTLLSGNSVEGTWNGSVFHAYFDPNGTAFFQREGEPVQVGQWVAHERLYCVTWDAGATPAASVQGLDQGFDMTNSRPGSDENCFDIYRSFNKVIWVEPESGETFKSVLVKGQSPNWQFDIPTATPVGADQQASYSE
jgi:hypothetical protein